MIDDIKKELLREYSIKLNNKIARSKENIRKTFSEHPTLEKIEKRIASIALDKILDMLENKDEQDVYSEIEDLIQKKNDYLRANNISKNYDTPKYDCNMCNDSAYYKDGYCICFKQKLSKRIFYMHQNMNIANVNLFNYSTEFFKDRKQRNEMINILENTKDYVNRLLNGTDKNLIFFGDNGLGKTYMLSALANSLTDMGKIVVYQSAPVLLEKIKRSSFTNEIDEINELIENCDLLIIDDLGKDYITEYTKSTLFNIINIRYNSNKPIAISTNLDLNELEEAYGNAIQSRLVEKSMVLVFEGINMRTK